MTTKWPLAATKQKLFERQRLTKSKNLQLTKSKHINDDDNQTKGKINKDVKKVTVIVRTHFQKKAQKYKAPRRILGSKTHNWAWNWDNRTRHAHIVRKNQVPSFYPKLPLEVRFLANRTKGRAFGMMCRPSVCNVCTVAKQYPSRGVGDGTVG